MITGCLILLFMWIVWISWSKSRMQRIGGGIPTSPTGRGYDTSWPLQSRLAWYLGQVGHGGQGFGMSRQSSREGCICSLMKVSWCMPTGDIRRRQKTRTGRWSSSPPTPQVLMERQGSRTGACMGNTKEWMANSKSFLFWRIGSDTTWSCMANASWPSSPSCSWVWWSKHHLSMWSILNRDILWYSVHIYQQHLIVLIWKADLKGCFRRPSSWPNDSNRHDFFSRVLDTRKINKLLFWKKLRHTV